MFGQKVKGTQWTKSTRPDKNPIIHTHTHTRNHFYVYNMKFLWWENLIKTYLLKCAKCKSVIAIMAIVCHMKMWVFAGGILKIPKHSFDIKCIIKKKSNEYGSIYGYVCQVFAIVVNAEWYPIGTSEYILHPERPYLVRSQNRYPFSQIWL